jgi:hypothetical protein
MDKGNGEIDVPFFALPNHAVLRSSRQLFSASQQYVRFDLLRCLLNRSQDIDQQQSSTSHLLRLLTLLSRPVTMTCQGSMITAL